MSSGRLLYCDNDLQAECYIGCLFTTCNWRGILWRPLYRPHNLLFDYYAPPLWQGALSDDARLTSVCRVHRAQVENRGPCGKTKIGTCDVGNLCANFHLPAWASLFST